MKRVILLLVILLLALSPVMAQEPAPVDETFIPASLVDELYQTAISQLSYVVVIVLGIGAVVLLGVSVPAFYYIYNSVPKAFQPVIREGALGVLSTVEGKLKEQVETAKANDINWDDDIWLSLYNEAKKQREAISGVGARDAPKTTIAE
jgi:hypothetical protein